MSLAWVIRTYQGDVKLALGENSKEPSSSTILAETSSDDYSDIEGLNIYKVLPAITEKKLDTNYIQMLPAQVQESNYY